MILYGVKTEAGCIKYIAFLDFLEMYVFFYRYTVNSIIFEIVRGVGDSSNQQYGESTTPRLVDSFLHKKSMGDSLHKRYAESLDSPYQRCGK